MTSQLLQAGELICMLFTFVLPYLNYMIIFLHTPFSVLLLVIRLIHYFISSFPFLIFSFR
jgi:hypothetical protein